MKETEINLTDEGFEEITGDEKKPDNAGNSKPDTGNSKPGSGDGSWQGGGGSGNRPDFRVVQADRDKDGNSMYVNVGGMWKNISKSGNEFYTLKIGQLKLLVFPNTNK
jgi:hypothetical protein